jgi:hypothetical protein
MTLTAEPIAPALATGTGPKDFPSAKQDRLTASHFRFPRRLKMRPTLPSSGVSPPATEQGPEPAFVRLLENGRKFQNGLKRSASSNEGSVLESRSMCPSTNK